MVIVLLNLVVVSNSFDFIWYYFSGCAHCKETGLGPIGALKERNREAMLPYKQNNYSSLRHCIGGRKKYTSYTSNGFRIHRILQIRDPATFTCLETIFASVEEVIVKGLEMLVKP